ncbi:MAG: caspase family protein [Treponema sp.]|jgi:hypothetical protein|nr:caspase family protein [Treponema sp.]
MAFPVLAQSRGLALPSDEGTGLVRFSASHALVIGESVYTNGWPSLPGVKDDIAAVRVLLEEQGFDVEVLENKTSADLKKGLDAFFWDYGFDKDIRLLVYYAGHGQTLKLDDVRDMGYIVPSDAPLNIWDERGFKRMAISMELFNTWARNIESRHVLFIFDSCFSGSIFATSRGAVTDTIDYKIASPVRQFISSGSANELVPDKSIFRLQLESALRGREADFNQDGFVSGSELGEYLQTTVTTYSNESQHPQYGKIRDPALDKGDFVFSVGRKWSEVAAAPLIVPPPVVPPPVAEGNFSPASYPDDPAEDNSFTAAVSPSPLPSPSNSFSTGRRVNAGFMNLALGLGSFTMGDWGGGATILGGYAAATGLIVYEIKGLTYDDPAAGVPGAIGLGVAGLTAVYGFVRPFIFQRSGKAAGIMDRTKIDVAPFSGRAGTMRMSYSFSF